jgi:acyl-[acyl-carrier-protein]-phospholipid O-acyltransferase/long-chain-fatty-acid--[acyl-carrier-protein] ligase
VWSEKFGLRILEGYGATEAAPVIATNTPMQYRAGTVGRLLPGLRHRIEKVPGIARGGRLAVSGPNIMLGYLRAERPGVLDAPEGGWYDTGDIVEIDASGFVTIAGRAKRFAKVGGEMISLAAIEEVASALWPGEHHAAVTLPDPRRGEQIVLVTDHAGADRESLLAQVRSAGHSELFVPKTILVVPRVPLLGTGKIDYPAVTKLAEEQLDAPAPTG